MSWSNMEDAEVVKSPKYAKSASGGNVNSNLRTLRVIKCQASDIPESYIFSSMHILLIPQTTQPCSPAVLRTNILNFS